MAAVAAPSDMADLATYPDDSLLDVDDIAYPCKGCGEILEEGKAFELAGHRWHIDCFRCNTCGTLLDSDANLLLLGDGSLICNNCTYSCSACGNKIEDLAILTGDQAYCAGCFRCRNCKKKIENLRYARTSQGMFCMECHDGLMARRRKKDGSKRSGLSSRKQSAGSSALLDKSLPDLPQSPAPNSTLPSSSLSLTAEPSSDTISEIPTELAASRQPSSSRAGPRELSPDASDSSLHGPDNLGVPRQPHGTRRRGSELSHRSERIEPLDEFFIPMALDPNTAPGPSPLAPAASVDSNDHASAADHPGVKPKSTQRKIVRHPRTGRSRSRDRSRSRTPQAAGLDTSHEPFENLPTKKANGTTGTQPQAGEASDKSTAASAPRGGENEKFKLQEAPKRRKSTTSSPRERRLERKASDPKVKTPSGAPNALREQRTNAHANANANAADSGHSSLNTPTASSPRRSQEHKRGGQPLRESPPAAIGALSALPKRGDSLQNSALPTLGRKEGSSSTKATTQSAPLEPNDDKRSSPLLPIAASMAHGDSSLSAPAINGGKLISRPMESPLSKSSFDVQLLGNDHGAGELFSAPRAPPQIPPTSDRKVSPKSGGPRSEHANSADSPTSPRIPHSIDDMSIPEDSVRNGGGHDDVEHSFLRKVSKSVRHARSQSDRGSRHSRETKWPKTPVNGSSTSGGLLSPDGLASPSAQSSPEVSSKEDMMQLREELRRERLRLVDRDRRIADLEQDIRERDSVQQFEGQIHSKRSTIVVLDAQKEMILRELDVLSAHIAAEKDSKQPMNVTRFQDDVVRSLANELRQLKESYTVQIEELAERKLALTEDVENLNVRFEKLVQDTDELYRRNRQLSAFNHDLLTHPNETFPFAPRSESRSGPLGHGSSASVTPNTSAHGLGIYTHHSTERSNHSIDSRDMCPFGPESTLASSSLGPGSSATTFAGMGSISTASGIALAGDAGHDESIMGAPRVVNMRKEQPTKKTFNWKRGGNVVKGATKGLKGAFSSNDGHKGAQREGSIPILTEGMPYGAMSQNTESPTTTPAGKYGANADVSLGPRDPHGRFGLFGQPKTKGPVTKAPLNGQVRGAAVADPSVLFGSDLELRSEYERVNIPGIVTRCIQEVELRGMDSEGIYRRSGGSSQVAVIQAGFEASNDYDISDPDLDINAVTSTLKQYFRKLPTPLITYAVYDQLLNAATAASNASPGSNAHSSDVMGHRIQLVRAAVAELPPRHRDCLAFLMFHLARVVKREKENLMTSLNCAVVFAPTIMRPESLAREMSDTQAKNDAVQFLIDNCNAVFMGDAEGFL